MLPHAIITHAINGHSSLKKSYKYCGYFKLLSNMAWNYVVRIAGNNPSAGIQFIEDKWIKFNPVGYIQDPLTPIWPGVLKWTRTVLKM
jgi:hypothetical protein